jgi:hypothetical protein
LFAADSAFGVLVYISMVFGVIAQSRICFHPLAESIDAGQLRDSSFRVRSANRPGRGLMLGRAPGSA